MTPDLLVKILGCPLARAQKYADPLSAAMALYDISTPLRQAAFVAQVGHESARLACVREIWAPAQCPWQARYEGRADLGNTEPGDGKRFMGRGLLQATGRDMYRKLSDALGVDLIAAPEKLESPDLAAQSAAWIWTEDKRLNDLADRGEFKEITRRINGGYNGLDDRIALYERSKPELGA